MSEIRRVLTLCTGNAARSVMLGFMFSTLSEALGAGWEVRTAGTHAAEGQAISPRTLAALERVDELGEHHFTAHRSHQLTDEDVAWADVIIAVEADHVTYVRVRHPDATDKVVQLRDFVRHAPLDEAPLEQVHAVARREPESELDVPDPAGGDQATYDACAMELWELAQVFVTVTTPDNID